MVQTDKDVIEAMKTIAEKDASQQQAAVPEEQPVSEVPVKVDPDPQPDATPIERVESPAPAVPEEPIAAPAQSPTTAVDINAILAEKTRGKLKSIDELDGVYDELEALRKMPKIEFADPVLEKANEWVRKGMGTAQDYIVMQSTDFNAMQPDEAHAEMLWKKDPNLTEEDIEHTLNKEYRIEEWNDDPTQDTDEVRYLRNKFFRDGERYKGELNDFKNQWLAATPPEENPEKQQEFVQKVQDGYIDSANQAISKIPPFEIKITDTDSFRYELKEEQKKMLIDDFNDFVTKDFTKIGIYNKDKTLNMSTLVEMYRWAKFGPDMINQAVAQAMNKAVKKTVEKDINNVNFDPVSRSSAPPQLDGIQKVAKALEDKINF